MNKNCSHDVGYLNFPEKGFRVIMAQPNRARYKVRSREKSLTVTLCRSASLRTAVPYKKAYDAEKGRDASRKRIAQVNLPNCRHINQPRAVGIRVAARSFLPRGDLSFLNCAKGLRAGHVEKSLEIVKA